MLVEIIEGCIHYVPIKGYTESKRRLNFLARVRNRTTTPSEIAKRGGASSLRAGNICFSVTFAVDFSCSQNLGWGAPEVKARGAAKALRPRNSFVKGCEELRICWIDEILNR
jgi:hypothetical protein